MTAGLTPLNGRPVVILRAAPLYADVGVLSWLPGMERTLETFLRQAKAMRMLDRVLFGTDQMLWPEAIGLAVERINGLDFLTVEEKEDIFYDNAARFLGLTEEMIARDKAAEAGR